MSTIIRPMIGPDEGQTLMGGFAIFKLGSAETGGAFALVEHRLGPRQLGAPVHTHQHEDEASYVLEGEVVVLLGDKLFQVGAGNLVLKPRGIPHTFWNPGATPARLLELIYPGGFERYFEELAALVAAGEPPGGEAFVDLARRYGLEMDFSSIPMLLEKYGLHLGG